RATVTSKSSAWRRSVGSIPGSSESWAFWAAASALVQATRSPTSAARAWEMRSFVSCKAVLTRVELAVIRASRSPSTHLQPRPPRRPAAAAAAPRARPRGRPPPPPPSPPGPRPGRARRGPRLLGPRLLGRAGALGLRGRRPGFLGPRLLGGPRQFGRPQTLL